MRGWATLLLPLLVLSGAANALGLTAPAATIVVDAPLLAPVALDTRALAQAAAEPLPAGAVVPATLAEPAAPVALVVDGELHAPLVEPVVEAPRARTGHAHAAKLARMDAAAAPLARAPLGTATRALEAAPPPRALPASDAMPARVISERSASAPASGPSASDPPSSDPLPPSSFPQGPLPALAAASVVALLLPLWLALYSRLRGAEVAANERRAAILAALAARPGIGASEIARELGCDPSTVVYHLRKLARARLVVEDRSRRTVAWRAARGPPATF